ncbi:hypothetical protein Tco_0025855 [Tanacetum coccineum]
MTATKSFEDGLMEVEEKLEEIFARFQKSRRNDLALKIVLRDDFGLLHGPGRSIHPLKVATSYLCSSGCYVDMVRIVEHSCDSA